MMRNNYREDGFIWFEDQISELADLLLNVQGLAHIYKKKKNHRWIRKVGDSGLRSALRKMSTVLAGAPMSVPLRLRYAILSAFTTMNDKEVNGS